jgi:hypothetical protein
MYRMAGWLVIQMGDVVGWVVEEGYGVTGDGERNKREGWLGAQRGGNGMRGAGISRGRVIVHHKRVNE